MKHQFTEHDDDIIILMTERGYHHRGIAKVLEVEPFEIIKRQHFLRTTKRLRV